MNRVSRLVMALILLMPLQFTAAQDRVPNTLEPITDDLYLFKGGSSANHYGTVLVTDEGILLVDTIDPEAPLCVGAGVGIFIGPAEYPHMKSSIMMHLSNWLSRTL